MSGDILRLPINLLPNETAKINKITLIIETLKTAPVTGKKYSPTPFAKSFNNVLGRSLIGVETAIFIILNHPAKKVINIREETINAHKSCQIFPFIEIAR